VQTFIESIGLILNEKKKLYKKKLQTYPFKTLLHLV
jgi:hypothetical protein